LVSMNGIVIVRAPGVSRRQALRRPLKLSLPTPPPMAVKKKKSKKSATAPAGDSAAPVNIESHLVENRVFKPAKGFAKRARIGSMDQYRSMWKKSIKQPEKFWGNLAKDLDWRKKPKKILEWNAPFAKWFVGGKLNVSENCLDRNLRGSTKNKAALIWEG